jgi:ubiquinone/menaquinone biosynthesis C-methylase UbiE
MGGVAEANAEAVEAWNGVLFDRFVQFRHVMTTGLGMHGDAAMRVHPPAPGDRVLDIGCGFGDTTQQLGALVGPEGSAVGVDAAERFVELAAAEADEAGVDNVRFLAADVQTTRFEDRFDYAFSRFGTMFFAAPVPALRNVREALEPGGQLVMVVWRNKLDNPWMHNAELLVERYVEHNDESDEPTCGPGPFSMANADTTSGVLDAAGFTDIVLQRCDLDILVGRSVEEAVDLVMALGPAAELLRLAGDKADHLRPQLQQQLTELVSGYATADDGVRARASSWIISATAP